jgi:hypothetical protein
MGGLYYLYCQNYNGALHAIDEITATYPEFTEFCNKQKELQATQQKLGDMGPLSISASNRLLSPCLIQDFSSQNLLHTKQMY